MKETNIDCLMIDLCFTCSVNASNRNAIIECVITAVPGNMHMVFLFVELQGET